jgi:hypothetical protein
VVGRAAAAPRRAALATHGSVAARAGRARGVRGPPPEPALEVSVIVPGDQELSPVATTQSGGIGIAGAALLAAAAFGFVWSKLRARGADMGYYGGGGTQTRVLACITDTCTHIYIYSLSLSQLSCSRQLCCTRCDTQYHHHCCFHTCHCRIADMMRNVNMVQMEELSPDIIAAARARRSRERCGHGHGCKAT